jgi:hypothetical protein
LTLADHFPEALARLLIAGESHKLTPLNNSDTNTMDFVVDSGVYADTSKRQSKSQTEHLADFATWSQEELDMVARKFEFATEFIRPMYMPSYIVFLT